MVNIIINYIDNKLKQNILESLICVQSPTFIIFIQLVLISKLNFSLYNMLIHLQKSLTKISAYCYISNHYKNTFKLSI